MKKTNAKARGGLSNIEIVTLAVYLLGGETQRIDTEDVAVKANKLAPGRFTWGKYPDQINIDTVRKRLWDAATSAKGELDPLWVCHPPVPFAHDEFLERAPWMHELKSWKTPKEFPYPQWLKDAMAAETKTFKATLKPAAKAKK